LDETETGEGTTTTLIDATQTAEWMRGRSPTDIAKFSGFIPQVPGLVSWDVYDAVLMPGDLIMVLSWRNQPSAHAFEEAAILPQGARLRCVRVVRDYTMFDRKEAPQYYPDVKRVGAD
jgi:hypothetical protein